MGGFIVLEDGRAYAAANWAFRATVEAIADALPQSTEGMSLAEWLRHDPVVQIYHNIDVRELTPANQEMLLTAIENGLKAEAARGPSDWANPEFWDGWIHRFTDLVKMIESVRRGEQPHEFNPHMTEAIPPTGERNGPGW